MSATASWSGPGLILSFFKLLDPPQISEETLEKWFEKEFVPGLLAAGAIQSASLYRAASSEYNKQNLIVYQVSDLSVIQKGAFQQVPRTSKLSLFEGTVDGYIDLDSRIYSFSQLYETSEKPQEPAPVIMVALLQPASGGEAELDKWYREDHNQQMSEQPGWWRTRRFNLLIRQTSSGSKDAELPFLAVHEFGPENQLGKDVKPLEPISDWTKKVMSEAKGLDAAIYHKQMTFEAST